MEVLLTKSNLLINEISPILAVGPEDQSNKRWSGSWIMSDVALEHAHSLQSLMEIGNFTSAFSILRLQFDALTRSVWLLWGVTDSKVERIMQDLTNDTANADNGLPSHVDMIKQIEKSAPAEATRLLKEFREVTWKASSSFVHGGIHAMKRHREGYPVTLVITNSSNKQDSLSSIAIKEILLILLFF